MIDSTWPDGLTDPILYWGDFHHMAPYVTQVARVIGTEHASQLARRYLLLDGVSDRAILSSASFGTTLLFNSPEDFSEGAYGRALAGLLTNNVGTWFRDPVSTILARGFSSAPVATGVDPALLVDRAQLPVSASDRDKVGVFLGRTRATHEGLWVIARRLADRLGTRMEWLDWGDSTGFREFASLPDWVHLSESYGSTRALDALSHLASCSVVVTDSYHAALIAWRFGIPAITASMPISRWGWRDKRELAASQYGALDFVVHAIELASNRTLETKLDLILDVIHAGRVAAFVQRQIEKEVEASLSALHTMLDRHSKRF
jgi:hypothetical protein